MPILSKRMMLEIARTCRHETGLRARFVDMSGAWIGPGTADAVLGQWAGFARDMRYAIQESVNSGSGFVMHAAPNLVFCMVAMEQHRVLHGGVLAGPVWCGTEDGDRREAVDYLAVHGVNREPSTLWVARLPARSLESMAGAGKILMNRLYDCTGWSADLLTENRIRNQQQMQITQAIEAQRRNGQSALYAFEKERSLLANIRAGDREGARRLLNEMLAAIFLASSQMPVLRARTIELMSCLTRAAIEDNPLLEPLIERNHAWTERLVKAGSFEILSAALMKALDEFIDGVYVHGVNRTNPRVTRVIDYISRNHALRISLADVAREAGVSIGRLSHLMREFTGKTVLELLFQIRIQHAQELLTRSDKSCTEIGYEVGFTDQSYFIKHFKRLTGTTPLRFRHARSR
ncbi:MAG: hypothetical protein A2498_05450 [Lentisphaerae bacterium RIFOXYC12_FULL_60_16]|nr:MAG: hypothetical protein A2498_05450 [Lentisphaerae bacterium RIFOXYC12_FULL_60_16]OGV86253.1 MAG: hypothetical protein A2340_01400 [Lentisphaerae bacterium RIFOXYB12_FULL_60_10]